MREQQLQSILDDGYGSASPRGGLLTDNKTPSPLHAVRIEIRKGNFKLALEKVIQVLPLIHAKSLSQNATAAEDELLNSAQLLLAECYIGLSLREKSMAQLILLKKIADADKQTSFTLKYELYKSAHEAVFEAREPVWDELKGKIDTLWESGEVEFCLNYVLDLLKRSDKEGTINQHSAETDYYNKKLVSFKKEVPQEFMDQFLDGYEFKSAYSIKSSNGFQFRKLIEFSHELICEHNLGNLCDKSLKLVLGFTNTDRGFVVLYESAVPNLATQIKFNCGDVTSPESPDHACYKLTEAVRASGHPFILASDISYDLYAIKDKQKDVIETINQKNIVAIPLMVYGTCIGLVYADGGGKLFFNRGDDIDTLESLCTVLAFAINSACHFNGAGNKHKSAKKNTISNEDTLNIQKNSYESFIGISQKKHELIDVIQKTTNNNASILVTGESGVGKEMVAKIIHYNGPRCHKEFVAFNCAAIPENLIESELFGFKQGAFTGADQDKDGLLLKAHGGTLFLDEIGEMPLVLQVKMLRVLQEKEFMPLGGSASVKTDVHVVCATNKNLLDMVKKGQFREDLYFRINVINIVVPTLRERQEDIPQLADHALRQFAFENNTSQKTLSTEAMHFIMEYPWPGNVRELINVMYNLCIFIDKPVIELSDLKDRHELFRAPTTVIAAAKSDEGELIKLMGRIDKQTITLSEAKSEFERLQIKRALKLNKGQITSAAYQLQMPRPQVSRLVKKYGLKNHGGDS